MTDKPTYKYTVSEEGNRKFVEVEQVGRFELRDDENAEEKARALVVSTQLAPEDSFKVEKVNDLSSGVITSKQTKNR